VVTYRVFRGGRDYAPRASLRTVSAEIPPGRGFLSDHEEYRLLHLPFQDTRESAGEQGSANTYQVWRGQRARGSRATRHRKPKSRRSDVLAETMPQSSAAAPLEQAPGHRLGPEKKCFQASYIPTAETECQQPNKKRNGSPVRFPARMRKRSCGNELFLPKARASHGFGKIVSRHPGTPPRTKGNECSP